MLLVWSVSVLGAEKAELDYRLQALTAKFEALQQKPEKRVPEATLRQAKGVVLLDRTKAGFIFAYQGGSGVALVRQGKSGKWSPAGFVMANEASLGFQIGGEQNFFVILLMDTNATRRLTETNFEFGGEARGTAGDSSAGAEGTIAAPEHSVLVYSDRKGLFGGAAIKGGAITPDDKANYTYYGEYLTLNEILFGTKVPPTPGARKLGQTLTRYSTKAR